MKKRERERKRGRNKGRERRDEDEKGNSTNMSVIDVDSPVIGSAQQIPRILRIDLFPYLSTESSTDASI